MEQGHETHPESQPIQGLAVEAPNTPEHRPLDAWEGYSSEILDGLLDG
jgi:hypothetical protein